MLQLHSLDITIRHVGQSVLFVCLFTYFSIPQTFSEPFCVPACSEWQCLSIFLCLHPDKRERRRLDTGLHVEPDQYDSSWGSRQAPSAPRRLRLRSHNHGNTYLYPVYPQPARPLAPLLQTVTDRINNQICVWWWMKEGVWWGLLNVCHGATFPLWEQGDFTLSSLCGGGQRSQSGAHTPAACVDLRTFQMDK